MLLLVLIVDLWGLSRAFPQQASEISAGSGKRELFSEGMKAFQTKEYEKAVQFLTPLVNDYPELEDYVRYFLAKTYAEMERPKDALAVFQELLSRFPDHPLEDEIQFTIAHLLFDVQNYHDALDIYKTLRENTTISQGGLYYKLGQTFMAMEENKEAVSAFQRVISQYPGHKDVKYARAHLQKILAKHPELTPAWTEESLFEHANALFNAKLHTSAIQQYEAFQKHYPKSSHKGECEFGIADAYFRLGKMKKGTNALKQIVSHYTATQPELAAKALYTQGAKHWNADRNDQARQVMQRVIKDFADTSWGDNAYYVLGRIFQSKKAYHPASQWYITLYVHYPESPFAEEALWRAGWSYYLDQYYTQAIRIFSRTTTAFPSGDYFDDSLYWKARSFEKQKKQQSAITTYHQLITLSPDSYYGIKAQVRLRKLHAAVKIEQKPFGEQPELSVLLAKLQQEVASTLYQTIALHVEKAFELHEVQLAQYARKEMAWLEPVFKEGHNPEENPEKYIFMRYLLARLYTHIGEHLKAIRLVSGLEAVLQNTQTSSFPYTLEYLKYPFAYRDLIHTYGQKNDLDPFLVAAIIRQESAYNPKALSYANARGLMQVIPATGKRVAKQLGLKNFNTARLYDPELSIAIGTTYLAGLLKKFDGDLARAIAGYNAGPGATNKWWPAKGEIDAEETVENITYRSTRNYVKRVLRNQYHYRRMYSDLLQAH